LKTAALKAPPTPPPPSFPAEPTEENALGFSLMIALVTLTISRFGGSGGQIGASITPSSGGGGGTTSTTLKHEKGNARDTD